MNGRQSYYDSSYFTPSYLFRIKCCCALWRRKPGIETFSNSNYLNHWLTNYSTASWSCKSSDHWPLTISLRIWFLLVYFLAWQTAGERMLLFWVRRRNRLKGGTCRRRDRTTNQQKDSHSDFISSPSFDLDVSHASLSFCSLLVACRSVDCIIDWLTYWHSSILLVNELGNVCESVWNISSGCGEEFLYGTFFVLR